MKTPTKQTAEEAYTEARNDVAALLDMIAQQVEAFTTEAQQNKKNWGYTGTIQHTRESLKQVLAAFLYEQTGGSEEAANQMIENTLAELRD
jgi:hypothetical protein